MSHQLSQLTRCQQILLKFNATDKKSRFLSVMLDALTGVILLGAFDQRGDALPEADAHC